MLQIKSEHRNYGINFPTSREEITPQFISELVKHVNVPNHHAIICMCSKVRLFDFVSSINSKKDYNVSMDVSLAFIHEENNEVLKACVGDGLIVDRSSLERGHHLAVPTAITYNNAARYIKSDSDLYKEIISGGYNIDNTSPEIYLIEFKIVPVVDIKAVIKNNIQIIDPYLATDRVN